MQNEKRQLTQNCGSSASDELLILIERLSVKGEDLKSAVTRGRLRAIRDPLCYQGFHLRPLAWLLMFARVGRQSWGAGGLSWVGGSFPGQWQTLHLILINASSTNCPGKDTAHFSRLSGRGAAVFFVPLFGLSAWTVSIKLGLMDARLRERQACGLHEEQHFDIYHTVTSGYSDEQRLYLPLKT